MITPKQRRINKLLKKRFDELSVDEKIELISNKYYNKQKITYEEYVILAMTNDEIWFWFNNTEYQIDHGLSEFTSIYITEFKENKKISERSENFTSIIELFEKFRIDGKNIKEIWDNVNF